MTPQDTLARFDEIREAAEFEMQQEMAAIAQACYVGTTPVGAKRRLALMNNIPALLALVEWQQDIIRDVNQHLPEHEYDCAKFDTVQEDCTCGLDALRKRIEEATT